MNGEWSLVSIWDGKRHSLSCRAARVSRFNIRVHVVQPERAARCQRVRASAEPLSKVIKARCEFFNKLIVQVRACSATLFLCLCMLFELLPNAAKGARRCIMVCELL